MRYSIGHLHIPLDVHEYVDLPLDICMYLRTYTPSEDSDQSAQSDQGLRCPPLETVDPERAPSED